MSTLTERFYRGVQRVDERVPDWYERIDKDQLNMMSVNNCLLAQLDGGTYRNTNLILEEYENGIDFAFDITSEEYRSYECLAHYEKLTEIWKEEIDKRLNS